MYIYLAGKPILPLQFELKPYEKELHTSILQKVSNISDQTTWKFT